MELQLTIPLGSELRHLLQPVEVDRFVSEYAGRQALLIKGSAEKFDALGFDEEAFFCSAERFEVNPQRLKVALPTTDEGESYLPILPLQARGLYSSGMTICATALSDEHPRLAAYAEGIRHSLSIPDMRFNAYLSPDDSGFNLHYDVQPIFLIQIKGRKRWWYGSVPISPQPKVYSSRYEKPPLDTLEEITLEPGDVLYLPAFSWHRARADGFSLGITLGAKGVHNKVMRRALEDSPFFQEWPVREIDPPIDPAHVSPGVVPEAARAYLEGQLEALREYTRDLSVEKLWQLWVDDVQTAKGPSPNRREGEVFSNLVVKRARRFPLHLDHVDDQGGSKLRLRHVGHSLIFETAAEGFIKELLAIEDEFSCADAFGKGIQQGLSRSESKSMLREMIAIGVFDPVRSE